MLLISVKNLSFPTTKNIKELLPNTNNWAISGKFIDNVCITESQKFKQWPENDISMKELLRYVGEIFATACIKLLVKLVKYVLKPNEI